MCGNNMRRNALYRSSGPGAGGGVNVVKGVSAVPCPGVVLEFNTAECLKAGVGSRNCTFDSYSNGHPMHEVTVSPSLAVASGAWERF